MFFKLSLNMSLIEYFFLVKSHNLYKIEKLLKLFRNKIFALNELKIYKLREIYRHRQTVKYDKVFIS